MLKIPRSFKTLNHLFDFPQSNQHERKKRLSFSFLSVKARVDLLGSLAWVANIYSPKIQWILLWFALHCSCSYFYCLARKAGFPLHKCPSLDIFMFFSIIFVFPLHFMFVKHFLPCQILSILSVSLTFDAWQLVIQYFAFGIFCKVEYFAVHWRPADTQLIRHTAGGWSHYQLLLTFNSCSLLYVLSKNN